MTSLLSEQLPHSLAPGFLKHLHHLLRFAELLDEAVHILHFHAAASGDSSSAGGVQNIGVAAFLEGHRVDDGFGLFE